MAKTKAQLQTEADAEIAAAKPLDKQVNNERMEFEKAENYLKDNILDKPKEFFTIEKLKKSLELDRKLSVSELLLWPKISPPWNSLE